MQYTWNDRARENAEEYGPWNIIQWWHENNRQTIVASTDPMGMDHDGGSQTTPSVLTSFSRTTTTSFAIHTHGAVQCMNETCASTIPRRHGPPNTILGMLLLIVVVTCACVCFIWHSSSS
jgi:hypothetical protein